MAVTPRDVQALVSVARREVATAAQLRRDCFPTDGDGRISRRRLQMLYSAGMLARLRQQVVDPLHGVSAPVYHSTRRGLDFLAANVDPCYANYSCRTPNWQTLVHQLALGEMRILIESAAAGEKDFWVENYTTEFSIVDKDAKLPEQRFRLYTLLAEKPKRLVCNPDFMFVMRNARGARVVVGEHERGTTHPDKAAALKSVGYAELAKRKLHRRWCEEASDRFMVVVTAPDSTWRDKLIASFAKKAEPSLYRFAALPDLTPASYFRSSVWHRCDGTVGPLVKSEGQPEAIPVGAREAAAAGRRASKQQEAQVADR